MYCFQFWSRYDVRAHIIVQFIYARVQTWNFYLPCYLHRRMPSVNQSVSGKAKPKREGTICFRGTVWCLPYTVQGREVQIVCVCVCVCGNGPKVNEYVTK